MYDTYCLQDARLIDSLFAGLKCRVIDRLLTCLTKSKPRPYKSAYDCPTTATPIANLSDKTLSLPTHPLAKSLASPEAIPFQDRLS